MLYCKYRRLAADHINPWIKEKNSPTFTELGIFCTFILKLNSNYFFQCSINEQNEVKTFILENLFKLFLQLYRVKYIKYLRARKYGLEHKCEINFSVYVSSLQLSHVN
jgi:hypothetical protein